MKKIIGFITILVLMFLLISCQNKITHKEFYEGIKINYETGDSQESVTKDFEFIYKERKSVKVEFKSNNNAITIVDNKGIVNRQITDAFVDITINITIKDKLEQFIMTFKVIKSEPIKELIFEASDFDYVIGEELPDYKNNLRVTLNGVDVKHLVVIDDSNVNFELVGVYEIKYKLTLDEDIIVKTIKVTVKEEPQPILPTIIGAKDFTYIIGEDVPNYLEGVTAIDGEGEEVNVTVDDSSVDLTKVGSYPLYFIAFDSHDNEMRLEKEVTVIKPIYTIPPVITGAKDFIYTIGEEVPNYLEGVTALDENNDELIVEVYDNLVDLTKIGTYKIFFVATDSSGNTTTVEKTVTVKEEVTDITPPVITGTKNFIYIIGEDLPNYLEGVTAIDDVDGELTVTVDDSGVDLLKEGVYSLFFKAVDLSNNETIIENYVTVIGSQGSAETVTETFNNIGASSSSYSYGDFVGENGISWSYDDSRTDQEIEGRALTFGAKSSAKLYTTLEKGISYFSLDAQTIYSGSTVRNIALYINGEQVKVFGVTSEVQTFTVDNLSYQESILLEIRNVGGERVTIDNVTLGLDTKTIEEKFLDIVTNNLSIPTTFIIEGEIQLTDEIEGVNIVWEYENPTDVNNQYINLTTGFVTIPEDDLIVNVNLKATLTYSGYEREKTFTLEIGEGEPVSIHAVRTASNGSQVKTKGIITSSVLKDNIYYAFMQDNFDGIYIESTTKLVVGDEVVIKGVKQTINGAVTLLEIADVKVKGTKTFNIAIINLSELNNYLGEFVQVTGYLTKTTTSNQTEYELASLDGLVNVQLPNYIAQTNLQSLLNGKEAGLKVTLEGYVYKKEVIYLISSEGLYIEDVLDNEAVSDIILASFDLPLENEEILDDINLPVTDSKFNSSIEWLSSNPSVLSDTGIVTTPNDDTTVTLYYEIKIDTKTIKSSSITVKVLAAPPLLPYYQAVAGKTGNSLLTGLRNIISNRKTTSYDKAKEILEFSDRDPNNPNNVLLIYNRASVQGPWSNGGTIWNREHVWPDSLLGTVNKSEAHNLKPANPDVNNSRGNDKFARGSGTYGRVAGGWYPGDEDRGDVARIMFYMITLYAQLSISTVGSLDMFIEWHYADPVDDFERNRNDVIYSYTNNRNPFIDHPHFVSLIWETKTYSTQKEEQEYEMPQVRVMENLYYERRRYLS